MNSLVPFTADIVRALGWAILHSIWQTFCIYACLRLMLRLLPSASARIKYNLSYLSLTGAFAWFCVTFSQQLASLQQSSTVTRQVIELAQQGAMIPATTPYQNQKTLMWLFPGLESYFPVLVAIYVGGVTLMGIKMIADLYQLRTIRNRELSQIDPVWKSHLDKLAAQLKISGKVELFISHYIQVPVMIGFLKPVILLPLSLFSNLHSDQIEAILLHELAHIKRNDYLLNIFQTIVETTLFFNPFVWWISKNIRLEREHCCDDLVIARMDQPLGYAKALVALEEYRLNSNPLAMAAANSQQHLFHRIKRIMEMKTKNLNYSQKILALLIVATGLLSIAWLNPAHRNKTVNAPVEKAASPFHQYFINWASVKDTVLNPSFAMDSSDGDANAPRSTVFFSDTDTVPAPPAPGAPMAPPPPPPPDPVTAPGMPPPPPPPITPIDAIIPVAPLVYTQPANFTFNYNDSANNFVAKDIRFTNSRQMQVYTHQALVDAEKAMKSVDWKKINDEVDQAMKKMDWNKINNEVNDALKNVDTTLPGLNTEEFKEQMRASIKARSRADVIRKEMAAHQVEWQKEYAASSKERQKAMTEAMKERDRSLIAIRAERKRLETDMERANRKQEVDQEDMQRDQRNSDRMSQDVQAAKSRAEDARQQANEDRKEEVRERAQEAAERAEPRKKGPDFSPLIDKLKADKLINGEHYTIQRKGDDLWLDGKKQPADVAARYKKLFFGKEKVSITGSDKGTQKSLNISIED